MWGAPAGARPVDDNLTPLAAERYIENVEILSHVAQRTGHTFAWFLQPVLGVGNKPAGQREREWYSTSYAAGMVRDRIRFYDLARAGQARLSNERAICAHDLSGVFDDVTEVVYEDGGHLFDNGNVIVARRIAALLGECGLVKPRGDPVRG